MKPPVLFHQNGFRNWRMVAEVFQGITKEARCELSCLGSKCERIENAIAAGATEIAVFTTPSEKFSQKNTNCTVAESLQRIAEVTACQRRINYVCVVIFPVYLGCPYEGEMAPDKVAKLRR